VIAFLMSWFQLLIERVWTSFTEVLVLVGVCEKRRVGGFEEVDVLVSLLVNDIGDQRFNIF
jgi:hypothetical protein